MSPKILGRYEDSSGCRSAQIANQEILKKLQAIFSSKTSSRKEVLEDGLQRKIDNPNKSEHHKCHDPCENRIPNIQFTHRGK